MDDESKAVLEEISKRNAGALDVCIRLWDALGELVVFDFAMLKQMDVLGSDLWDLYNACDKDLDKLHASIMQKTAIEKLQNVPGSKFYQKV